MSDRCNPANEAVNPIVVALDGKSWDEILTLILQLRTTGCILKVNDLLFAEGINNLLPKLSAHGRVMADLKCHDIPNTVENTVKRLRACPPWAVTIHASAGMEALESAVKVLEDTPTKVLAITVLTSIDPVACQEIYNRNPLDQILNLANIAKEAGVHGFVCSPEEVGQLKRVYPKMTYVVPGIRSPGINPGDQKRISTPKAAMEAGANHIVMGRQILNAPNPVEEVRRVLKEELNIELK
ncbi:MAG: orotidine-5'-phosphate decarboxylase [Patescibacteria group bacterium]